MASVLYVGTAGSDDPTRAGLPFNFALGAIEAGYQPQIFLAGEAACLMKDDVAAAVMPVAKPPLKEMFAGGRGSASTDLRLRQVRSGPWGSPTRISRPRTASSSIPRCSRRKLRRPTKPYRFGLGDVSPSR